MTTKELIAQVRSVLDEVNKSQLQDDEDIVPALNRAQDRASSILARHYEQPLLAIHEFQTTSGVSTYPIPRDSLEDRLEKVEFENNGSYTEVRAISYREITKIDTTTGSSLPAFYSVRGKDFILHPPLSGTANIRLHYLKAPLPLAQELGQITKVGTNYVVVEDLSESLQVGSYVNCIDHRTGELIGQLQVKRINGNRLEFRDTPSRPVVNQVPVSTLEELTTASSNPSVEILKVDDYLTPSGTGCIPFMSRPLSNFYIGFAEGEMRRKLGDDNTMQASLLAELEKDVERSWVGREVTLRVASRNPHWPMGRRLR